MLDHLLFVNQSFMMTGQLLHGAHPMAGATLDLNLDGQGSLLPTARLLDFYVFVNVLKLKIGKTAVWATVSFHTSPSKSSIRPAKLKQKANAQTFAHKQNGLRHSFQGFSFPSVSLTKALGNYPFN